MRRPIKDRKGMVCGHGGQGKAKNRFTRLLETGGWLIKSVGGFFVKRRKARGAGQGCPSDAL